MLSDFTSPWMTVLGEPGLPQPVERFAEMALRLEDAEGLVVRRADRRQQFGAGLVDHHHPRDGRGKPGEGRGRQDSGVAEGPVDHAERPADLPAGLERERLGAGGPEPLPEGSRSREQLECEEGPVGVEEDEPREDLGHRRRGRLLLAERVKSGLRPEGVVPPLGRVVGLFDQVAAGRCLDPQVPVPPCGTGDRQFAIEDGVRVDQLLVQQVRDGRIDIEHGTTSGLRTWSGSRVIRSGCTRGKPGAASRWVGEELRPEPRWPHAKQTRTDTVLPIRHSQGLRRGNGDVAGPAVSTH